MAEQKFNTGSGPESGQAAHVIEGPLFEDEDPLDLETHGGLVILDTGQVAEVTPVRFIPEGGDTSLNGKRVQPLPFDVIDTGNGREIAWRRVPYDPARPTIGLETESLTMQASNAQWWEISPDGETIRYPHGLAVQEAEERGHQPELLKNTTESGSPKEKISAGYQEFTGNAEDEKYYKQVWMVENGLMAVPLSTYPDRVKPEDITEHPYTQMLSRLMPRILEYGTCLSEQINIQWKDPEAGSFALNAYELLGPVLGIVSASSPARDGSLHTTLSQHYEHNPEFAAAENAKDYEALAAQVRDELGAFMDQTPYDWRELSRGYGSPAGGVIAQPAPVALESMLHEGDRQLRGSEAMTIDRVLGPHANRWRADKGVLEISNLSLGGDHPDKMAAAEEVVIKSIVALQEYYGDEAAELRYDDSWEAVIPRPEEKDNMYSRKRFVDAARVNTMIYAMFGKDRKLFDADWQERTPREIFDVYASFIDQYAPEPLSKEALGEIRATLKRPPSFENSWTVPKTLSPAKLANAALAGLVRLRHPRRYSMNDPLAAFYRRNSKLTATEAIRLAEPLDNMNPPITLNQLVRRFAGFPYRIRLERHDAKRRAGDVQ